MTAVEDILFVIPDYKVGQTYVKDLTVISRTGDDGHSVEHRNRLVLRNCNNTQILNIVHTEI
jgi:hypothetical protein